ncbi:uncharacterized protein BDZ83DRAFT_648644 [Colletotrichum acutatum]|uniref:Uncharacterized protein n=1 Tax=Glomerella acutata TaxID=27357 RepID=A0AAD8XIV2_GLOAC|nr:uncharacterized protein BDZ83DRAFT_648644 [Colletotrichum acutatum]KAK1728371.1 hypothetical protein BDZ83DRAFT_648644 [Colletotrichum acutatum]
MTGHFGPDPGAMLTHRFLLLGRGRSLRALRMLCPMLASSRWLSLAQVYCDKVRLLCRVDNAQYCDPDSELHASLLSSMPSRPTMVVAVPRHFIILKRERRKPEMNCSDGPETRQQQRG